MQRNFQCEIPNPQSRKGFENCHLVNSIGIFFGFQILIFYCVGLQIPRNKGFSCRFDTADYYGCVDVPARRFAARPPCKAGQYFPSGQRTKAKSLQRGSLFLLP